MNGIEFYCFVWLLLLLLININISYNNQIKNANTLLSLIFYILIVRLSNIAGDLSNYVEALNEIKIDYYYLKEIIFWLYLGSINLVSDDNIIFVISDLILLCLISNTLKKNGMPIYFVSIFFIAFHFFLGHQNIYRQWLGTIFILVSGKRKVRFISVFIHNACLFPLASTLRNNYIVTFSALLLIYYFAAMNIGYMTVETGENTVVLLSVLSFVNQIIIWKAEEGKKYLPFLLGTLMLGVWGAISSTYIERFLYLYLGLTTIEVLKIMNKSWNRKYISVYVLSYTLPVIITPINVFLA